MNIPSSPQNPGLSGGNGTPPSSDATKQKAADQTEANSIISNIFLSAAAALGVHLVTGPVKLLRGSSLIFGKLIMQLGSTMWEQLKKMAKSPSSSPSQQGNDPLQSATSLQPQSLKTPDQILKTGKEEGQPEILPFSNSSVNASKTRSSDPLYKGPARTEEDYKTSFKNIIERCSHTEDTNRVNYLAGALDRVINFKINRAVKNNPAIDASKNAEKIAITVLNACRLAPSPENIQELSPIIKERITVLKEKQESMVQKRLLSRLASLEQRLASLEQIPAGPDLPAVPDLTAASDLTAVPTHEIKVSNRTTDPTSKKDRVVKNVFNEWKKEQEYNSKLERLYKKFSEPLSNKTDDTIIKLIGKEYDEMINEKSNKKDV